MQQLLQLFKPNSKTASGTFWAMVAVQAIVAFLVWTFSTSELLPTPMEIVGGISRLMSEENLLQELATSTILSLEAMAIATVLSLLIAYATVIPFFKPLGFLVSKGRFLTLVGLSFVFTLMTSGGHQLKIALLVFGITVFFVTSMVAVIQNIPKYEYAHARTLRMSEWQVVWEVVILGRLDQVFEMIRQNFAISWMMLTMVEGISRSEGGIGTLLLNQNKHFHLDAVFAIQIVILLMGIGLDYLIGFIKKLICPYADLAIEK